jgi:hypothetical protein
MRDAIAAATHADALTPSAAAAARTCAHISGASLTARLASLASTLFFGRPIAHLLRPS